jgi:hypothetical protein
MEIPKPKNTPSIEQNKFYIYHYLYISVNTFTDNYHNNTWHYHDSWYYNHISYLISLRINNKMFTCVCSLDIHTVVKELRSKMFGQHPGYFKAVFLMQTRIIIVSIYKYTVYIMFWIMILYDCNYYLFHFLSKYHLFLQCKIRFFYKL